MYMYGGHFYALEKMENIGSRDCSNVTCFFHAKQHNLMGNFNAAHLRSIWRNHQHIFLIFYERKNAGGRQAGESVQCNKPHCASCITTCLSAPSVYRINSVTAPWRDVLTEVYCINSLTSPLEGSCTNRGGKDHPKFTPSQQVWLAHLGSSNSHGIARETL